MDIRKLFFGERSLSKVAAVYESEAAAQGAARAVERLPHMQGRQVQIVRPSDRDWGRRVEPEGVGIWRTAVRAHVTCAGLGFAVGLLGFLVLWFAGVTAILSTPGMSLAAMLLFGTMFGLMAGGLVTIRPDDDAVVAPVREAVTHGRWSCIRARAANWPKRPRALGSTGAVVFHTL